MEAKPPHGELVSLAMARVHPAYAGLTIDALLSALRVDLTFAAMDRVVAVSWALADGRQQTPELREPNTKRRDVALDVVGGPRLIPVLAQEVEKQRGDAQLPLVGVARTRQY